MFKFPRGSAYNHSPPPLGPLCTHEMNWTLNALVVGANASDTDQVCSRRLTQHVIGSK